MTEFGKTLREAREAKGLTTNQIADQTHLLHQIVEDLEHEDFHRISAPIYGRGFVKLYCEAVGLDPKPLVDEFMAILSGEREPAIRLREVELPPEEPTPAEPPRPTIVQPELEPSAAPPIPAPTAETLARAESPAKADAPRYRPDYTQPTTAYGPSVNIRRLAILAGGAILALVLLFLGGRALYRATMTVPAADAMADAPASVATPAPDKDGTSPVKADATRAAPAKAKASPPAKPAVKRTAKPVPPLYID